MSLRILGEAGTISMSGVVVEALRLELTIPVQRCDSAAAVALERDRNIQCAKENRSASS